MDTVLIVDDSSFIVEGLIAFLKKKYRTLAAYGGAECLEILKREIPSVIILDIMMEPMDGWETLALIKENPNARHIPVIMFSAKKISPEEADRHRVNIDDFIIKPVSPNKITEAIEKVVARRDTHRMVVERWRAAGIGQEKIDEYFSLATSLEVDLSLCQNMKVQYDMTPHESKDQEEFNAVIKAVEERILQERDMIETLAREMNEALARRTVSRDPAKPGSPLPGPEELVPLKSSQGVSDDEGTPGEGNISALPAVTESEKPVLSRAIPEPEEPVIHEPSGKPDAGPEPAGPVAIPDPVPAGPEEPAGHTADEPGSLLCINGPADRLEETGREHEPVTIPVIPHAAPVLPVHEPPVITERKVIPAELDVPPDAPVMTSQPGAGTDVPMPWDTGRDRKGRKIIPERDINREQERPAAPQPAPGIFTRVLALVKSLFGRKK